MLPSKRPSCFGDFPRTNPQEQTERDCNDCAAGPDCLTATPKLFTLETTKGWDHVTIPMILFCPNGHRHIDEAAFEKVAHHTHACQECGLVWRPAKVNTHGVHFLPGYKNEV